MSAETAPPSFVARLMMLPIRAWRLVSTRLPPRCRFHPSCSAYALEAIGTHGTIHGAALALRRIGRCHPWHAGGLDPVPPNIRSHRFGPRRQWSAARPAQEG